MEKEVYKKGTKEYEVIVKIREDLLGMWAKMMPSENRVSVEKMVETLEKMIGL